MMIMREKDRYNKEPGSSFYLIMIMIFLFALCTASCVSIKPANTINRAENRVIKLNQGIKNQVDRYPSLADKAFKVIIRDTVKIPSKATEFEAGIIAVDSLTSLTQEYKNQIDKQGSLIDSLVNAPLEPYPLECQRVVNEMKYRIQKIQESNNLLKKESDQWFKRYTEIVNREISGVYEDEHFKINYKYSTGTIHINPIVKDSFVIVDKEEHSYNVKIRKNFWQDFKFYPFIIALIALFYFFGDIIFGLIKKGVSLLRKLIFKI